MPDFDPRTFWTQLGIAASALFALYLVWAATPA